MQAFPDTTGALRDVGVIGTLAVHLEILVGAVGNSFERPGPKSVSPATNCSGVAVVVWRRWIVDMACSLIGSLLTVHSLLGSGDPSRLCKTPVGLVEDPGRRLAAGSIS
jgi:hypothetical protein